MTCFASLFQIFHLQPFSFIEFQILCNHKINTGLTIQIQNVRWFLKAIFGSFLRLKIHTFSRLTHFVKCPKIALYAMVSDAASRRSSMCWTSSENEKYVNAFFAVGADVVNKIIRFS